MKLKTKIVTIAHDYKVEYEYEDHLERMIEQIKNDPIYGTTGWGASTTGNVGSYSFKRIGNGKEIK